jgi:Ca2+-binding RTX toxin-like protein
MAKASVRANYQIDFRSTIDIGMVATGTPTIATSTLVRITYNAANYDVFTGDFVYDSVTGELIGGTITGIRGYRGGSLAFSVSDISMPVASFLAYVQAGDTQGALADIFHGDDSIKGSNFADYLIGYDGNDTLNGGGGVDSMEGGAGDDLFIANTFYDVFVEADGGGTDTVLSYSSALLDANVENLILAGAAAKFGLGNETANNILGNGNSNILIGYEGNDTITGGAGNDSIDGWTEDDSIDAGAGNDLVFGFDGNDTMTGGAGNDTLVSEGGDNSLSGGPGKDLYVYEPGLSVTDWVTTGDSGIDRVFLNGPLYDWDFERVGDDLYVFGMTDASDSYDQTRTIRIVDHYAGAGIAYFEGDFGDANLFYGGNPNLTRVYTPSGVTGKNQGKNAELIVGGDASELVDGNGGQSDFLLGAGGDDTVVGVSAATALAWLDGGDGNDSLAGGAGNDNLRGGAGNDTIDGGGDNPVGDLLFHGDRADFKFSADGVTVDLNKQGAAQSISADQGTDILIDIENVRGSGFDDEIIGDGGPNWLFGGLANDSLAGNGDADTLEGAAGNDTLTGGESDDELYGADGDDLIQGGAGFDFIEGWAGNDTLDGGGVEGEDLVTYFGVPSGVIVNLSNVEQAGVAAGTAKDGFGNIDTLNNIVGVQGSDNGDMIFGNDGYNYFEGNAGNDTLDGGGGSDGLDFFNAAEGVNVDLNKQGMAQEFAPSLGTDLVSGFEEIYGSFFSDTLIGDGNANFLLGQAGKDSLAGNAGNDTIYGGRGNDWLSGGDGIDTIDFHRAVSGVSVNIGKQNVGQAVSKSEGTDVLAGFENIIGSELNDKLTGNGLANEISGLAGNDVLAGLAGNDTLDGGGGADVMSGGADDDLYLVDNVKDKLAEAANAGHDLVRSTVSFVLAANVDDLELLGDSSADINGAGNATANKLTGTDGDNILDGKGGADTMTGGLGDDVYVQDSAGDLFAEEAGEGSDELRTNQVYSNILDNIEHYTFTGKVAVDFTADDEDNRITGTAKNDTLTGAAGDDSLNGGAGADSLLGGKGDDALDGGGGNDNIVGGEGNDAIDVAIGSDTVRYTGVLDGLDTIDNFDGNKAGGQDVLNLDALFDALGVAAADRVGRVQIVDNGSTVNLSVDLDGNTGNGFELAVAVLNTADEISVGQDVIVGT